MENVESVSVDTYSFRTGEDHSKWAVATDDDAPWVCIGDINRMVSSVSFSFNLAGPYIT